MHDKRKKGREGTGQGGEGGEGSYRSRDRLRPRLLLDAGERGGDLDRDLGRFLERELELDG